MNSNTQSLCRCCVEAGILVGVCMPHYLRVNISCQRHSRSSSRHTHTHTLTGQTDESMFSVANQFTIILISIDLIDSVSLFKLIYFVCTHFSASVFCVLFCLWRWVYEGGSEQNRRKDHRIGQWPNVFSNIFFSFEIQTKKPNRDRTQFPVAMRLTLLLLCIIHTRTCPHTHKPNLLQSHRARK